MSVDMFIHPNALCESEKIGKNTRIWAFVHILSGAKIGDDCNICDHVFIENDVLVGNRVTIKSGVQLWDGVTVEDDVFIGPNVTFCNDKFPRSKHPPKQYLPTIVRKGASIGANATILPGVTIGQNAMVGAGCVVTRDVPPKAIVVGNPAVIKGYINSQDHTLDAPINLTSEYVPGIMQTSVPGVQLHHFPIIHDMRGRLTVGEFANEIPFIPKRYFMIYDVPSNRIRGEHAHIHCKEFIICVAGSVTVLADDGVNREEFILNSPHKGLYVGNQTWCAQRSYSKDSVLMVFASELYDADDYIRDYDTFLKYRGIVPDAPGG